MSFYLVTLCLTVFAASSLAVTPEERAKFLEAIEPIIVECGKDYGLTIENIKGAKESGTLEQLDPCFAACFYKKTGLINGNGVYDADVAIEKTKKYAHDPTDIEKYTNLHKTCLSVNDASVSDGEKGCDRAKLLLSCFIQNKGDISPFTP